eukprot:TRINITY_DN102403_c0_g1_i1.p1 TRINITY_DN102403_c0_g1~~TRINITY_DN102403_c0_g1_i1.p1  ORF type:complete len:516 (-),score=62.66 TRINITY_DN102403_c0_g1_i1:57-1604(-)
MKAGGKKGFKEGDWICESCGDHQFARNDACRKCGIVKPVVASNNQTSKAGDWICPNPDCRDLQFERNMSCRRCGEPKPEPGAGAPSVAAFGKGKSRVDFPTKVDPVPAAPPRGHKPGDWTCSSCGDHQFARNASCRKCGAPKDESDNFQTPASPRGRATEYQFEVDRPPRSSSMDVTKGKGGFKDGDWMCEACGDHQFARNDSCRKCGMVRSVVASNNQESKAGDWICPNPDCRDLQFERNMTCRRCGEAKPSAAGPAAFGKGKSSAHFQLQTKGAGKMPSEPPQSSAWSRVARADSRSERHHPSAQASFQPREDRSGFKEGDWICEACGDHQFARNDTCRKCGVVRSVVASNNQTSKAGDWICPNPDCRDLQFERNMSCRRCGEPKPDVATAPAFGKGKPPVRSSPQVPKGACSGAAYGKGKPAGVDASHGKGKPGDWTCPSCGDHQFARNETCRRCGEAKPQVAKNGQAMKPGDWICPNVECGDVQFARNEQCRKCGEPRPENEHDRSRSPLR